MFTLNPLPPQLSPALVEKLVKAEPATIGHFRDWGFMDPGIKALQRDVRIAGPAITIHQPGVDGTIMGYAMGQLRPGDVLVVDRCGDVRHAGFGGLVCYAAKVAKVAGVIIDGVVADVHEIRQYGVPVSCGGVSVHPGDVVIADETGIVVMDSADAEAAADRAIQMQFDEIDKRRRLDAGEKLPDISGATKALADALAKQK